MHGQPTFVVLYSLQSASMCGFFFVSYLNFCLHSDKWNRCPQLWGGTCDVEKLDGLSQAHTGYGRIGTGKHCTGGSPRLQFIPSWKAVSQVRDVSGRVGPQSSWALLSWGSPELSSSAGLPAPSWLILPRLAGECAHTSSKLCWVDSIPHWPSLGIGALFPSSLSLPEVLEACSFFARPLAQEAKLCCFCSHPQLGLYSSGEICQNCMLIVVCSLWLPLLQRTASCSLFLHSWNTFSFSTYYIKDTIQSGFPRPLKVTLMKHEFATCLWKPYFVLPLTSSPDALKLGLGSLPLPPTVTHGNWQLNGSTEEAGGRVGHGWGRTQEMGSRRPWRHGDFLLSQGLAGLSSR